MRSSVVCRQAYRRLLYEVHEAERTEVVRIHDEGRISNALLHSLEHVLGLEEHRLER
jgi:hypothetical protein